MVITVGVATTDIPVLADKDAAGAHVYVSDVSPLELAPLSTSEPPTHTALFAVITATGFPFAIPVKSLFRFDTDETVLSVCVATLVAPNLINGSASGHCPISIFASVPITSPDR